MNPDRQRAEELWTRAAAGDPLSPAEEADLLRLVNANPALRDEMLSDFDLERTLGAIGRSQPDGDDFVRSLSRRLDLERDGSKFLRRVEQGLSRKRSRRRAPPQGGSFGVLIWVAAAGLLFLTVLAGALGSRATPERRIVQTPAPVLPEPAAPRPEPPAPVQEPRPAPTPVDDVRPISPRPAPDRPLPEPPKVIPVPPTPTPTIEAPPAPVETRTAVAVVESVDGAASGAPLLAEQPFAAVGLTVIRYADGTRLELARAGRLTGLSPAPGKRISLAEGSLKLDVPRQPAAQPLVVVTPQADVTVLGTRFTVTASQDRSRVDVEEGRVRIRRLLDRATVDVKSGHFAIVAPGAELAAFKQVKFVKGVNFNGPAVMIEGQSWMSHEQAVADGLGFTPGIELFSGTVTPRPAVSAEMATMLNTSVFRQKAAFGVAWTIPNGTYDVFFWIMENVKDNHRRFDASIEGVPVLRDIGRGAVLGEWGKMGPFRVTVQDGVLNVDLTPRKTDAHLMGLAVFEAP
jgi:hypothetical protein